jgi:ABC-type antimicrobial peptide transport system permease subunit
VINALRNEVRNVDPDLPLFSIMTLEDYFRTRWFSRRVLATLFSIFAVVGLVLSAVGIYAVTAYSVSQRTEEIGVRMALGAQGRQIAWLVLRGGLRQLALGLPLGLLGAVALTRLLERGLRQVTPYDPATFFLISAILSGLVVAACLIPARRAARLRPLDALRTE